MARIAILFLLIAKICIAQNHTIEHICHGIQYGVAFDIAPDGRFFVTEKGQPARIKVFNANGTFISIFSDLRDSVRSGGESGLLGITLDPNFNFNHFVYVFYTSEGATTAFGDEHIIVQRFTEQNNVGIQPVRIFDYDLNGGLTAIHIGGNIHFRPSDSTHIYVSIGDFMTGYFNDTAARVDNIFGKILRISKYPAQPPPADNPFYDDGDPFTGNCDWVWASGLRNSFDFCFGPNDSLYATENGTSTRDEVNLISRGGFYGWPYCEGSLDGDTLSIPCHAQNAINPIAEFAPPLPALTGITFYTGTRWSQQHNHLITVDYVHANLIDLTLGNPPAYNTVADTNYWIDGSNQFGFTDIVQGADGCLYVMQFGDSVFGGIYKICPEDSFPSSWSLKAGPNPFNTSSTIWYTVQEPGYITLELFDARGRLVKNLHDGFVNPGFYSVEVNPLLQSMSSGIYICVMTSEHFNSAVKLIVE